MQLIKNTRFFSAGLSILLILFLKQPEAYAIKDYNTSGSLTNDLTIEAQLKKAVNEKQLNFPILTQKIYREKGYQALWFNSDVDQRVWNATDLISTAPHYGLNQTDYHCTQLSAGNINILLTNDQGSKYKPMLDIFLTDAMLSFIAHLHYGRVNPSFPISTIDNGQFSGLKADSVLIKALSNPDFTATILNVQPKFIGYEQLQQYMKLLVGQYVGDCYEISEGTVTLIAINLERWRWLSAVNEPFIQINIPSFMLNYIEGNKVEGFKVVVGKPSTPTPVLSSEIRFFTTAPDWTVPRSIIKNELLPKAIKDPSYLDANNFRIYDKKGNTINVSAESLQTIKSKLSDYVFKQSSGCDNALGQIVFNFENPYSVYVHDTPDRDIFSRSVRALSHGCIRVENPERLVLLLLEQDNASTITPSVLDAMKTYKRKRFNLKRPVPIFISYFTCEIKDGAFLTYKDIYFKDKIQAKLLKPGN